jgi:hypothetical protein
MTLKITIRLTAWKDELNFKFKFNKNMPRKSDIIPINNESLDRRVKLTKEDKELGIPLSLSFSIKLNLEM